MDVRRLKLKPTRAIDYSPGQCANLSFLERLRHSALYSIGRVTRYTLEFHIRLVSEWLRLRSKNLTTTSKSATPYKFKWPTLVLLTYAVKTTTLLLLVFADRYRTCSIIQLFVVQLESGRRNPHSLLYWRPALEEIYTFKTIWTV